MIYNSIIVLFILTFFGFCRNKEKDSGASIIKDALFIETKMTITALSSEQVWVSTVLKNNSKDTFVLYKPLLPTNDLTEKVFGLFSSETLNAVDFNRIGKEKHLTDEEEVVSQIVPRLEAENLLYLLPDSQMNYNMNIAKLYDFKKSILQNEHQFSIVYSVFMPYIVNNNHVIEMDSIDKARKPVYYSVRANRTDNLDSIHVRFYLEK